MNPSVAPLAGKTGKPNVWVAEAVGDPARCTLLFALDAAKTPKFLLSPVKADRFTAAIVSIKTGLAATKHPFS